MSDPKRFFILFAIATPSKDHAQIPAQLSAIAEEPAKLVWNEKGNVAFCVISRKSADEIYKHAARGLTGVNNMAVLELGLNSAASGETLLSGWLNWASPAFLDTFGKLMSLLEVSDAEKAFYAGVQG